MLRIGEAAKKYDISNRTLRYWEDMGILESKRTENDYRYYDDDNDFSHQWLEECSMDFETFISNDIPDSKKQLDLLEPIRKK